MWVLGYLGIILILYIIIYMMPKVSTIFTDTYIAEYGTLETTVETDYLVVREERLYVSDNEGNVTRFSDEGSLKRSGSRIVQVGGMAYNSQERGIVSYCYDGMEGDFPIDKLNEIKPSALVLKDSDKEEEKKGVLRSCASKSAQKGNPIFKIVDNKEWYLICWLSKEDLSDVELNQKLLVEFNDKERVKMVVRSLEEKGKNRQVILACNRYYEKFDSLRIGKCNIIKNSKDGIILESDSIVKKDGHKGVYTLNKLGTEVFIPVNVLITVGDQTVVSNNRFFDEEGKEVITISNYAKILRPVKS